MWGRLGGSALPSISSCPSGLSWRGTKGRGSWREGQGFRAQLSQHTSTLPFPVPPPVPAPSTLLPPPDSLPHHCYVLPALFFTPLVPSLPSLDCGFSPAFLKKTPVPPCQGQLPRAFKPQNCSARLIRVSSPSHVRGSRGTERSRNLPEVTQFTGGRSPPKAETRKSVPSGGTAPGFEFGAPDTQVGLLSPTPHPLCPPPPPFLLRARIPSLGTSVRWHRGTVIRASTISS